MKHPLQSDFQLGFLGAGQLARMSALQAFRYGIRVAAYSDRPENEPLEFLTPVSRSGSFDDAAAMTEFAKSCDLLTLENEFISSEILKKVEDGSKTKIFPSPDTFALIENKLIEKQTFENAGIPVAPYGRVETQKDLSDFGARHGWPFILKSSKGGYDGYGNKFVESDKSALTAFNALGGDRGHDILAEAMIPFTHELAVQVARNETGTVVYPCCETVQKNHICVAVKSPAPVGPAVRQKAQELAIAATEAINGKGIFAFEFFLTTDETLLLNESAPRPHNSGHYTIEGCITSQFENHIRAVLGLPLGPTGLVQPAAVMINLLGTNLRPSGVDHSVKALEKAGGHLHMYGKSESKPGRKMGHYTLTGGKGTDSLYDEAVRLTRQVRI